METLVVKGAIVLFEPASGWKWEGWDGKLTMDVREGGIKSESNAVAVESDLIAMGLKLMGKSYRGSGFDDIPGTSVAAQVLVDGDTLSQVTTVNKEKVAIATTTGKFTLSCVPSFRSGSPPIPDPAPIKQGTWKIEKSGQAVGSQ